MARDGYAWWYVDALSDDGAHALTLIAFVGSVFSPYYAAARRRAPADPEQHVAVNVALHGPRSHRWTMTERGRQRLQRDAGHLRIGPSTLRWHGEELGVELDEWCVPWPRRVRGRLRLSALALPGTAFALDAAGRHRWQPIAPLARIEVAFDEPALRWSGHAYFDHNRGDEPLERAFRHWSWARRTLADGGMGIDYDVLRQDGSRLGLALACGGDGRLVDAEPLALTALPRSRWGVARPSRGPMTLWRTLEDGPFYARSLLRSADGRQQAVHESLSLERFDRRWVQALLPFRMPRRA